MPSTMSDNCFCHNAKSEQEFLLHLCPGCFGVSFTCAALGFVFGIITQNLGTLTRLCITVERIGFGLYQQLSATNPVKECSVVYETEINSVAVEEDDRDAEFMLVVQSKKNYGPSSIKSSTSSKTTLVQRGSSFANSMRKLSGFSGLQHGLVEARGKELEIVTMDRTMRLLLGCRDSTSASSGRELLPTSVHDLLPEDLRSSHRKFLTKAAEDGALPSSLMHPMRNVPMLRCDGSIMRVDICVGVITKVLTRPIPFSHQSRGQAQSHWMMQPLSCAGLPPAGTPEPAWRRGSERAIKQARERQ
jgi:hypothetical protein